MKKSLLQFTQLLFYTLLVTSFTTYSSFAQTVPSAKQSGSSFTNDNSVGTVMWNDMNQANDSNGVYAYATMSNNQESQYLMATNFGFNIPSAATIKGIEVRVTLVADDANSIEDNSIRLVKGGNIVGDDKARVTTSPVTYWPDSDATVVYGGPAIRWRGGTSLTWDPSDINSSDFGVAISAVASGGASTANIDHVSMVVYFDALNYYYDGTGDLSDVNNWGLNPDGSGPSPANFQQDGQIFHIEDATPTLTTTWGVGGHESKVVVGDGSDFTKLTVASGVDFSASVEVLNNAVYESQSSEATVPTLTNMATGSRAIFSSTTAQDILDADYYDLEVSGSTKTLVDQTNVANSFTFTGNNVTVDLDAFNVVLNQGATITGASSTEYFITSGSGSLEQYVPASSTDVEFPVGTSDNYNPATINVDGSSNGDYFLVRTYNGIFDNYQGDAPAGDALNEHEVEQTWIITERVVGETTIADVTLQWNEDEEGLNFDRDNSAIGYFSGSVWVGSATSSANGSDPYTLTLEDADLFQQTPYGIGDEQSPVPVELINFTATLMPEGGTLIEWATASELNNSHFLLQYTYDGQSWETLTKVAGHGTTTQMHEYRYNDIRPVKENICYRLKQVDYNGEFEYSNVACVEAEQAGNIAIYPNPVNVNQHVNIDLGTEYTVDARIKIVNMQGQVVKHIQISDAYTTQLEVSDLASGWYTIQVVTPGNSFAERILLTR